MSNFNMLSPAVAFGIATSVHHQSKAWIRPRSISAHPSRQYRHTRTAIFSSASVPKGSNNLLDNNSGDTERALVNWLQSNNIELRSIELRHEYEGVRGMYATNSIEYGDILIQIPRDQLILINTYRERMPNLHVLCLKEGNNFWKSAKWYIRLAVKLLDEIARGHASSFVPYINALPANPTSGIWELYRPDRNSADEDNVRSQLRKYGLWSAASEFITVIDEAHCLLIEALADGGIENLNTIISKSRFAWAVCIAVSRGFALPDGPETRDGNEQILDEWAYTGGMNLGQKSATASIPKRRLTKPNEFALVPGLDMINHWTGSNSRLLYEDQGEVYKIRTGTSSTPGEEVFISYGAKGNDELGLFYGVVEALNPASVVHVLDLLEWTTKRLGKLVGNGIGLDPAPGGQRSQILNRVGLLDSVPHVLGIRADGADEDLERILRVALATEEELGPLLAHKDHKQLYKRLGKWISLQNEVAVWDGLIEWCDRSIDSVPLSSEETAEVQNMIEASKGSGPVSVGWNLKDASCLGAKVYKWEKLRVLKQTKARYEHFRKVSLAVGTVCTVLVPPSQSMLRTQIFDGVGDNELFGRGAGLRSFNIPHQDIQAEIEGESK